MPGYARLSLAALLLAALAGGQSRPERFVRHMPPEIVISPPLRTTVDMENAQMRVLRHRMGAFAAVRSEFGAGAQGALLVAVTPLNLSVLGKDGKRKELRTGA